MVIDLSNKKLYTKSYFKIQKSLKEHTRFKIVYGGSGSSKSHSAYQHFVTLFLSEKNHDFLVMRKYGTTIENSVYKGIKFIILNWGLGHLFEFRKQPYTITNIMTGRTMSFIGVDDPEKLKSIVNIKWALLEEATDFNFEDFKEINRRLRGIKGIQLWLLFNPISHTHWIKKHFFDKFEINIHCSIVKCYYTDNQFLTDEDIEQLEALKFIDENDYRVYVLGEWGILTDRLIFKDFKECDKIPKEAKQLPCGLDFGFYPDPAAILEAYIQGQDLYINEILYHTNLVNIRNDESDSIEANLDLIGFDKNRYIIADSSEPKSIQELRSAGLNVYGVKKYPGSIKDGIKLIKSYKVHILSSSKNLITEFENYVYKVNKDGEILPEPVDAYNHLIDALRYILLMKDRLW